MVRTDPILFKFYPDLKDKVPWIPLLTNIPTPVDRLTELEKNFNLDKGKIFIKRDDKNHHIYGGNKLRKFEFIFGHVLKKKKRGIMTFGGIGTNHGLPCAIIAKMLEPPLRCELFLIPQPLTWHVQRSLLLFNFFGAKLHLSKGFYSTIFKAFFFRIFHPKHYIMLPGGSPLLGKGSALGMVGFINALFELKEQMENGEIPEPDVIFVPGGSSGTSAGLIAGCKILGLKTKVHVVAVSEEIYVSVKNIIRDSNKALRYLEKCADNFPKIDINENDFEFISGYLGSEYGAITKKSQNTIDLVMELEGYKKDFKLETTYTGKAMAAMFDYLKQQENKNKTILYWNTYNSNDLDKYLKETDFQYKKLPKKFHKLYEESKFQCWQVVNCPEDTKKSCPAYLNHEYRFWKITDCLLDEQTQKKAIDQLKDVIKLEDA